MALGLAACGSSGSDTTTPVGGGARLDGVEITVGSANFPENVLLAEIYGQALEAKGAKVTERLNIDSREVYFKAIEDGKISLLPEYTNSLLSFIVKPDAPTANNVTEQVEDLQAALPPNLTVLTPSTAEDKDVIVCNEETADKYRLRTLSDLARSSKDIIIGAAPEFAGRSPFGLVGLKDILGADFKEFKPMKNGSPIVDALKANAINCGNLFSTSSFIRSNDFVTLEDDKLIVPNEAVIPLIAKDKATPAVQAVLDAVSSTLDTEGLMALMVKVEQDGGDPAQVAKDWLAESELRRAGGGGGGAVPESRRGSRSR